MVAIPIVARQVVRGTAGRAPFPEIDPYEVAYLTGGAKRAAEVAIAEFTHSGALRVDSTGQVHKADPAAGAASLATTRYGIELGSVADLVTTAGAREVLARCPGIARIRSSAGHGPEENHDETLSHMRSAAESVVKTPRAHRESSRATRAGTCRRPLRTPQCPKPAPSS